MSHRLLGARVSGGVSSGYLTLRASVASRPVAASPRRHAAARPCRAPRPAVGRRGVRGRWRDTFVRGAAVHVGRIIDLSVPLSESTQVYPGDPVPRVEPVATIEADG